MSLRAFKDYFCFNRLIVKSTTKQGEKLTSMQTVKQLQYKIDNNFDFGNYTLKISIMHKEKLKKKKQSI